MQLRKLKNRIAQNTPCQCGKDHSSSQHGKTEEQISLDNQSRRLNPQDKWKPQSQS